MALVLRQSTAVDVLIGPFVDSTDGVTAETALTISQADVLLSKNGQALAQKNDNTAAAHDANGYYNCELDATDTNTVGTLVLTVAESGALPVRHEFQVIEEAAYDAIYAGSAPGPLPADDDGSGLTEAGGTGDHLTAINLPDQTMNITGNITGNLSGSVGSVTGAVGSVTGNVGGTINGLTATAQGNIRTAVGLASANLDTQLAALPTAAENRAEMDSNSTQLAAIVADTNELQTDWASGGRLDLILDARASQSSVDTIDNFLDTEIAAILEDTGTTIPATLSTIDGVVDAIKAVTDNLPDSGALSSLATASALATVDGNVDAILEDTGTTLPASIATIDSNVDAILVDTDTTIPGLINALNDISVSDILTTQMTESYAADGSAPTVAQALMLIQQMLSEFSISGTTLSVKKLDGSTTAATFTLDDDESPTSITRSG